MKKLRIGVIGLGMGRWHVEGYLGHPQATVAAIADTSAERLQEIGDKHSIAGRYTDAQEMLAKEKLDVVSIATPNKFHCPLALAAFKAGCHVLCEKPMAMNAAEGRKMLAAAKKAKRRLMINFSYRFNQKSQELKKQVDSGVLGDIYFARTIWHRRRGMPGFGGWFGQKALAGGGPLIDLGVHRLDFALWLMGYPKPTWVLGSTYNKIASAIAKSEGKAFDVEDLAVGLVKFANGATLEIEASWAANLRERELMQTQLLGDQGGMLQFNLNEGYEFEAEIYREIAGCQVDSKIRWSNTPAPSSYYHFVDSIIHNRPHIATGEDGLVVMELLDALYASAASGAPVKIG
jgi:predicted dehydrogenase